MKRWPILLVLCAFLMPGPQAADARRVHVTPEQKAQLANARTVFVEVLALTEKGPYDASPLTQTIQARMEELGYQTTTDAGAAHDVALKVKCEERKTWTGTSPRGGDVELADAPDRLWTGPACLLTYLLDNKDLDWKKEVRTPFADAAQAAGQEQRDDPGPYAMERLNQRLLVYDFPVLLSAEWGQLDRLLALLENPQTPKLRKVKILSVLSTLQAEEALPELTRILETTDLQQEAIQALTGTGIESLSILLELFQTSPQTEIRTEAAKALGNLAARSGDPRTIPPLVEYVKSILPTLKTADDINYPLLTEVVWAIGKLRWDHSIQPIAALQNKIWMIHDNSEGMANLREATSWTYKQIALQEAAMLVIQ
jgi:HEAT repeat protein